MIIINDRAIKKKEWKNKLMDGRMDGRMDEKERGERRALPEYLFSSYCSLSFR